MISVVIPVYNVDKYLEKCLDSVINQTYRDLEIILINDGSTDNSETICLKYAKEDSRIIYVHKRNEGQGIARNLALNMASGKYFTAIDSDDWWDLQYCEKMLHEIEKFDADFVLCDFYNIQVDNELVIEKTASRMRIAPNKVHNAKDDPNLINTCRTVFCTKLYKTDFLRHTQAYQPAHPYEDMATVPLLTAMASKIARVPLPLYYYLRNRNDSTTNIDATKHYLVKSLNLLVTRFKNDMLFEKFKIQLMKKNHSDARFILSKMNPSIERNQIKESLCSFLKENYQSWIDVSKHSFCVIGSPILKKAVELFLFDPEHLLYLQSAEDTKTRELINQCDFLITDIENLTALNLNDKCRIITFADTKGIDNSHINKLAIPKEAEDEDCFIWDLSDLIFFNLNKF